MRTTEGLKAGGILCVPDGIVLVRRRGSGRDGLVIPKGSIEPQDKGGPGYLARAAEREVLEETGYNARAVMFLGEICRTSIDVDSPEKRKRINVFLMAGTLEPDPAATPQEEVCIINPGKAVQGEFMRYEEERAFLVRHLGTLVRARGW